MPCVSRDSVSGYPCSRPKRLLASGLVNPIPPKTICAGRVCAAGVDTPELLVRSIDVANVDVKEGRTNVGKSVGVQNLTRVSNSCKPERSELEAHSGYFRGTVKVMGTTEVTGSHIRNAECTNNSLLLGVDASYEADMFFRHCVEDLPVGRSMVSVYGLYTPIMKSVESNAFVQTLKFCECALQRAEVAPTRPRDIQQMYIRASLNSGGWGVWREVCMQAIPQE